MSRIWFELLLRDWGIHYNSKKDDEYKKGLDIIEGIPPKDLDQETAIAWLKDYLGIEECPYGYLRSTDKKPIKG